MSDHPVHRDDITALRGEGDLSAYIRQLNAEGRARRTDQPAQKPRRNRRRWGAIPIPPDHKPGAWPPGTSPPGPEHQPGPDWDDAVTAYRATRTDHEDEETP